MILHRNVSPGSAKAFAWPKFGSTTSKSFSLDNSGDSFNLQSLTLTESHDGPASDLHNIDRQKIEEAIITGWIEEAERQDELNLQIGNTTEPRTTDRKPENVHTSRPDSSFSRRVAQQLMEEFPEATFGWLCRTRILPDNVTPDVLREHAKELVARIQFIKNNPG